MFERISYVKHDPMFAWGLNGEFGALSEIRFLKKLKSLWIEKKLFRERKPLKQVMEDIPEE